ncbi:Secreted protein with uncharacterized domain [Methylophaga frappieri]|uniref:Secreted protein with uncharacterized domain n=2 Tax=Methylophaga frappieri (strain ATCC BAA-2434 / DSM 25690 / JAM7) TaxID=754477 RepID=I1YLA4_METFJ|nr:Secreted protein with uncharacterized domain [Methylophaga frappieri]
MLVALLTTSVVIVTILGISRGTRIVVLPEAALPAKISMTEGVGMVLFNSVYALTDSPRIRVSALQYQTYEHQLLPEQQGKRLHITLEPKPAEVRFSTDPEESLTRWYLNNEFISESDTLQQSLLPGEYDLKIDHPYYEQINKAVSLTAGQHRHEIVVLTPITGQLQITSTPPGAVIHVDNQVIGESPLTHPISGGVYQITLSKSGFDTVTETLEVTRNHKQVSRVYQLPAAQTTVSLSLSPGGGSLTVDDIVQPAAKTIQLAAGQAHRVVYQKAGYVTQQQIVTPPLGQPLALNFDLQEARGQVQIMATPQAAVSIDGKRVGETPLTLTLQTVPQQLSFQHPGYRTITQTVTPSRDVTRQVSVTLIPEAQAQLAESPKRYQHPAGGEMLLFQPNTVFTLGAARDSQGQRANEFLHKVHLNRPFYAGVTEVSIGEYQQFDTSKTGNKAEPITAISWLDAARFCNWLSEQQGLPPVYQFSNQKLIAIDITANGYRLLTEAEWEWLARSAKRPQPTRFAWGDSTTLPKHAANIADEQAKTAVAMYVPQYDDGYAGVAPIGRFSKEISGLQDQAGNVSEWTHDVYRLTPPDSETIFPQQLDKRLLAERVVKGANWQSGSLTTLRAAYREGLSQPRKTVGFRVGRYLNKGEQ